MKSEEKSQIKSCGEGQGTNIKVAKEEKSKDFLKFNFGYIENKYFSGIVSGYWAWRTRFWFNESSILRVSKSK